MGARRDPASGPRPPVGDCEPGRWAAENAEHIERRPASWLRPSTLWAARNQIVSLIADPVPAERARFVAAARERHPGHEDDLVVDRSSCAGAVLVLGDPGEGDLSQYAVLPALHDAAPGIELGFVCSDVIYPAGEAADYPDKFTWPYRHLAFPLWAAPGNHDWYDGLRGFLAAFCDVHTDGPPRTSFPPGPRGWLAWRLWHRERRLTAPQVEAMRADLPRATRDERVPQPAPYFAVDTRHVRFVVIDTGISGRIDDAQRAWLARVSAGPRPKVLLTGKPLVVNGAHDRRTDDVDAIVRDPAHHYVAAIGGDTHNYQRYTLDVGDRTITYVVTGGGGAFMHATHTIGRVDLPGCSEDDFRVFPLRRDSLVRYSQVIDRKIGFSRGLLVLTEDEAARFFVQHRRINAVPADAEVDMARPLAMRPRIVATVLASLYAGPWFHRLAGSVVFDWDRPRVFKQFLRLEPGDGQLVIRCLSASGCAGFEHEVTEEDRVTIPLPRC